MSLLSLRATALASFSAAALLIAGCKVLTQPYAAASSISISAPWTSKNGLAFIGDSLSCQQSDWTYQVSMLTRQRVWTLDSSWNQCKAGQDTAYMLSTELPAVLALPNRPNFVSVLGGTNDVIDTESPTATLANLSAIVSGLRAAGITPVMNTIPPIDNGTGDTVYALNFGTGAPGHPVGPSIATLAASLRLPLVDNWSVLADPSTRRYKAGYSQDGVHPNASPGYTSMATNWANSTAALFAPGTVLLPTPTKDQLNLLTDPFVSSAAAWQDVLYSNFTTAPTYRLVTSCTVVTYGNCLEANITTDGNQTHYAQFGPGLTSYAPAGHRMLLVLPYSMVGANALGGWSGATAGLNVFTGLASTADPFVVAFSTLWYGCTNCIMAIEYVQPPLPTAGPNVGLQFYFGGSTNTGTVTLQFGQAAIYDMSTSTLPGT